jgi:SagB-type dehydrogenase family enzyme
MDEIFRLQTTSAMSGWYEDQQAPSADQDDTPRSSGSDLVDRVVENTRVMIEPEERDAFKESRPGVRKDIDGREFIELPLEVTDTFLQRYRDRRSYRNFSLKPISLEDFSHFVACLAEMDVDDNKHKFLYASPGGLNPTQVYFHIKPGRIEGVPGGAYYYHPEKHGLMQLSQVAELDRDMHIPFINTPIFDECAFSVYLVADLNAIVPAYGDRSMHFISLEVGTLSQLLETAAPSANIGLCQIGTIEFDRIAQHFDLNETHMCVHSLVGGAKGAVAEVAPTAGNDAAAKASDLLRRVKELSDSEARDLLRSQKRADDDG